MAYLDNYSYAVHTPRVNIAPSFTAPVTHIPIFTVVFSTVLSTSTSADKTTSTDSKFTPSSQPSKISAAYATKRAQARYTRPSTTYSYPKWYNDPDYWRKIITTKRMTEMTTGVKKKVEMSTKKKIPEFPPENGAGNNPYDFLRNDIKITSTSTSYSTVLAADLIADDEIKNGNDQGLWLNISLIALLGFLSFGMIMAFALLAVRYVIKTKKKREISLYASKSDQNEKAEWQTKFFGSCCGKQEISVRQENEILRNLLKKTEKDDFDINLTSPIGLVNENYRLKTTAEVHSDGQEDTRV